jgi:hypothetical protein
MVRDSCGLFGLRLLIAQPERVSNIKKMAAAVPKGFSF